MYQVRYILTLDHSDYIQIEENQSVKTESKYFKVHVLSLLNKCNFFVQFPILILCFLRRESGYCSIEWSTPSPYTTQNGYFSLTGTEQTGILSQTDVRVNY